MMLSTFPLCLVFFLAATILANMDVEMNQSDQRKEGIRYPLLTMHIDELMSESQTSAGNQSSCLVVKLSSLILETC